MNIISGLLAHRKRIKHSLGSDNADMSPLELSKKASLEWASLTPLEQANLCAEQQTCSSFRSCGYKTTSLVCAIGSVPSDTVPVLDLSMLPIPKGARRRAILNINLCSSTGVSSDSLRREALMDRKKLIDFLLAQSTPYDNPSHETKSAVCALAAGSSTSVMDRQRALKDEQTRLETLLGSSSADAIIDTTTDFAAPGLDVGFAIDQTAENQQHDLVTSLVSSDGTPGIVAGIDLNEDLTIPSRRGFGSVCHHLTAADIRCLLNYKHGCVRRVATADGSEHWAVQIAQLSSVVARYRKRKRSTGDAKGPRNPHIAANSFDDPAWRRKTGIRWKCVSIGSYPTEQLAWDAYYHACNFVYNHCELLSKA